MSVYPESTGRAPESVPAAPLSRPTSALLWMLAFLGGVALLSLTVLDRLAEIFAANPFFNSVILAVLAAGIAVNLRQVQVLGREIGWIDWFRRSNPDRAPPYKPRLLAPMARLLAGRKRAPLAAQSMRTILDSVQVRLDESRDLSRYLIGLAIFLGLLGTFWGLLVTIRSVTEIIGSLDVGQDTATAFTSLKENLREPLGGMGTSFSTSLFGLASSLIIGFLDLQAGHAQTRFSNELEEWLSSVTQLSASHGPEGEPAAPAYLHALLEQTAESLDRAHRVLADSERTHRGVNQGFADLAVRLDRLNELLETSVRERSGSGSAQEELIAVLRQLASAQRNEPVFPEELRDEMRLLARTIAAALENRREFR